MQTLGVVVAVQPSAFSSQLNGLMLSVTPENVLRIRDTLHSEAIRLQADYNTHSLNASTLPELGPDPVSTYASAAFNPRLQGAVAQFQTVIDEVKAIVQTLTDTAHGYGLTEQDIVSTMHGIGSDASGARLVSTSLVADQPPAKSDVPGLVIDTSQASAAVAGPNPDPAGFDANYARQVLNPDLQVGMGRP